MPNNTKSPGHSYLAEIETLIDPGVPDDFTLWVPDAWMQGILKAGLLLANDRLAAETLTRFVWNAPTGQKITFRADSDPDAWSPVH